MRMRGKVVSMGLGKEDSSVTLVTASWPSGSTFFFFFEKLCVCLLSVLLRSGNGGAVVTCCEPPNVDAES